MTRTELVKMAKAEIKRIKKVATEDEISRLNFETFYPNKVSSCIYGQMTGDCGSPRAKEIMPKQFDEIFKPELVYTTKNERLLSNQDFRSGSAFTALEKYLYIADKKTQKHIISFLKGKTPKLIIK